MRIRLIILIIIAFVCTACFSFEGNKNLIGRDYFSINLEDSKEDILKKLSSKKVKVKIKENKTYKFVTFSPIIRF